MTTKIYKPTHDLLAFVAQALLPVPVWAFEPMVVNPSFFVAIGLPHPQKTRVRDCRKIKTPTVSDGRL